MTPSHLTSRAMLALACLTAIAGAQSQLQNYTGSQSNGFFGAEVAPAGDIDNDGVPDFAVAAPGEQSLTGRVHVYSGSTLTLMRTITGSDIGGFFGEAIVGLGDTNGDGYGDLLVTSPNFSISASVSGVGRARVYSGQWIATGTGAQQLILYNALPGQPQNGDFFGVGAGAIDNLDGDGVADYAIGARDIGGPGYVVLKSGATPLAGLGVLFGTSNGDGFGVSMTGIGDVLGDSRDEFVVGAYQFDNGGNGYVRCFSPTLATNYTVVGTSAGDRFGASVAALGDVNGDGNGDFAVGAPGGGYVRVCSGLNGSTLYTLAGDGPNDRFGASVAGSGDLDGDGVGDLIVGAPGNASVSTTRGFVRVFSGATGAVLFTIQGTASSATDETGASVASVGDLDGDGLDDLLVGAPLDDAAASDAGAARLHSGTALAPYISGDKTQLSVSAGGTLTLQMQSTTAFAGSFYAVLGSTSGSSPGFVQDGVLIPLNMDAYFDTTVNSGSFPVNGYGYVSANGLDQAQVPLAAGSSPSLIGVVVTHASVLMDPSTLVVQAASNAFDTLLIN